MCYCWNQFEYRAFVKRCNKKIKGVLYQLNHKLLELDISTNCCNADGIHYKDHCCLLAAEAGIAPSVREFVLTDVPAASAVDCAESSPTVEDSYSDDNASRSNRRRISRKSTYARPIRLNSSRNFMAKNISVRLTPNNLRSCYSVQLKTVARTETVKYVFSW